MTRATPRVGADHRMTARDDEFDVIIEDERWATAIEDVEGLAARCRGAARDCAPETAGGASLLLADDKTLRDLNLRFRGKDKPTNVLSFPAGPSFSAGQAGGAGRFLGDIAIAYETTLREAQEMRIAFRDHAAHLIVHGLLHLTGHDHESDDDAEKMERLETQILASLEIADPYAAGREHD